MSTNLPIKTTDEARDFLTTWMRANFPTDRTFDRYVGGRLAGDFAYQLANALALHAAPQASAAVVTDEQITAGAAVLAGYKDLSLNWRNAAIDVFQAMSDAAAAPAGGNA